MPSYYYEAMHSNGERANGVVEASSKNEAVSQIRSSYELVIKLEEVKSSNTDIFSKYQKLNVKTLAVVCKQFSIILSAGLPLTQTVDIVSRQTSDKLIKKILKDVSADIANGWSLSYSFAERGKNKLPEIFIESIRSGEETGNLAGAFLRMSLYFGRMDKLRTKMTNAMIYPAFVLVVAFIVIVVIMSYAIPTFAKTFTSMNMELPLATKVIISVSNFMNKYIWVLVFIIAGLVFAVKMYSNTPEGRIKTAKYKLAIPVFGDIITMISCSQFAHTMSAMVSTGVPILHSLEISARSMSNACLSKDISDIIPYVESGHSIGEALEKSKNLPELLVYMTSTGEATGSLENILQTLGEFYDNEVDTLSVRAVAMIEPIIITILAFFVVIILLSIYLPMFSMYGAI